jgi:prepilin-type N-terminal cleavage/methylation domain-containing protein
VRHRGFTLIELLITVALILVMYVMLYGPWTQNYQEQQKRACAKNLELIHVALQIYAADHRGAYPFVPGAATADVPLSLLIPQCTVQTELFVCPGGKDSKLPDALPFAGRKISYAYYMGYARQDDSPDVLLSDRQVDTQRKVAQQLVFSPDGKRPGNNHHKWGGNFLLRDGSVQASPALAARDLPVPSAVVLLNPKP